MDARDGGVGLGYDHRRNATRHDHLHANDMIDKASATAPRSRALELSIAVLATLGLAIAVYLVLAHAGIGGHLCQAIASERVSCDKVAASEWAILAGVPLAAWGALSYLAVLALGLVALRPGARPGAAGGLLVLLTAWMSLVAIFLAYVSERVIGVLCPFCALSWVVSFVLLGVSVPFARRAGGIGAALRADLADVARRPGPWATLAAALLVLAAGLFVGYHRPVVAAATGPLTVLEFSDYQCPHCARMHVAERAILARNPQLRLERRHFPLDQACNPLLKRPFHARSCELARAALCADAQGRFATMDDALFANQQAQLPLDTLATQVGLDLDRFHACLESPETAARLRQDIDQGIALGVRATPSYAEDGKLYEGDLAQLLAETAKRRR